MFSVFACFTRRYFRWLCQFVGECIMYVRLVTSIKPTVDAISIMVFMGEYRHNAVALFCGVCRFVEDSLVAVRLKRATYVAESHQVQYTSAILRSTTLSSPSPSSVYRTNETRRITLAPVS